MWKSAQYIDQKALEKQNSQDDDWDTDPDFVVGDCLILIDISNRILNRA